MTCTRDKNLLCCSEVTHCVQVVAGGHLKSRELTIPQHTKLHSFWCAGVICDALLLRRPISCGFIFNVPNCGHHSFDIGESRMLEQQVTNEQHGRAEVVYSSHNEQRQVPGVKGDVRGHAETGEQTARFKIWKKFTRPMCSTQLKRTKPA